jgi:hypothetical protein
MAHYPDRARAVDKQAPVKLGGQILDCQDRVIGKPGGKMEIP